MIFMNEDIAMLIDYSSLLVCLISYYFCPLVQSNFDSKLINIGEESKAIIKRHKKYD